MTKSKIAIIITSAVLVFVLIICSLSMTLAWSGILSKDLDDTNLAKRILQITDLHIMSAFDKKQDAKLFSTLDMIIDKSSPDLVVVTGDISSANDNKKDNIKGSNKADFEKFGNYMENKKVYWTFTFGNHDSEYDPTIYEQNLDDGHWTKPEIATYLSTLSYCVYQDGTVIDSDNPKKPESHGNYYETIQNQDGKDIMSLIYMDSNNREYDKDGKDIGYGNFSEAQIDWYKNAINEIAETSNNNESEVLPSLAFFHIPMQEFSIAYKDGNRLLGSKFENVCGPAIDDQMYETMLEMKSTQAVFVGHDHMNSFSADYNGIRFSYGFALDHNVYLVPQLGGTIINIKNDGSFTQQGIFRNRGIGKPIITEAV